MLEHQNVAGTRSDNGTRYTSNRLQGRTSAAQCLETAPVPPRLGHGCALGLREAQDGLDGAQVSPAVGPVRQEVEHGILEEAQGVLGLPLRAGCAPKGWQC